MEIVNGYMCRDCTDVSYAKKNIDPAHPKDGPQQKEQATKVDRPSASVQWGGALADLNQQSLGARTEESRPRTERVSLLA
ncbi:MAG: hypothetical protein CFE32_09925 [Alphaproteobacteria bacterium PA3]|nr:MAG: hypothetical protein CFE32_09925 [Alphaproteobacteria bacterium PA3]